jgi:hypothetical protein
MRTRGERRGRAAILDVPEPVLQGVRAHLRGMVLADSGA